MNVEKGDNLTVQGLGTPVPAAVSEQAGSQASRSSNCNVTSMDNLVDVADIVTSKKHTNKKDTEPLGTYLLNPFNRSSLINRSPPPGTKGSNDSVTHGNVQTPNAEKTSDESTVLYEILGDRIKDLADFVKNRSNIHKEIKEMIKKISLQYGKVKLSKSKCGLAQIKSTQTTPKLTPAANQTPKRIASPMEQKSLNRVLKKAKRTHENNILKKPLSMDTTNAENVTSEESTKSYKNNTKWSDVVRKSKTQEVKQIDKTKDAVRNHNNSHKPIDILKKRKYTRSDAIIIKQKGETTYADILKKIKSSTDLKEMGNQVQKIRRTQAGELILLMNKKTSAQTPEYEALLTNALEKEADIRSSSQMVNIEIRDLDEIVTHEEIVEALKGITNSETINVASIKSLHKSYGGTQTALIKLPATIGVKILEAQKIRIGWVVCRLREKTFLSKCFKCWQLGHLARNCQSDKDKSNWCMKCTQEGHFAKNCPNEPKCALCSETDDKHMLGSRRCPAYQKDNRQHGLKDTTN